VSRRDKCPRVGGRGRACRSIIYGGSEVGVWRAVCTSSSNRIGWPRRGRLEIREKIFCAPGGSGFFVSKLLPPRGRKYFARRVHPECARNSHRFVVRMAMGTGKLLERLGLPVRHSNPFCGLRNTEKKISERARVLCSVLPGPNAANNCGRRGPMSRRWCLRAVAPANSCSMA